MTMYVPVPKTTSQDVIRWINEGVCNGIDAETKNEFCKILNNAKAICNEKIKEGERTWYWNDELYQIDAALKSLNDGSLS